jgi:hypothetical protein
MLRRAFLARPTTDDLEHFRHNRVNLAYRGLVINHLFPDTVDAAFQGS